MLRMMLDAADKKIGAYSKGMTPVSFSCLP